MGREEPKVSEAALLPVHVQWKAVNGVSRCPLCGSSKASFDGAWLTCQYCRNRWNTPVIASELQLSDGIDKLSGTWALSGAGDTDTSQLVTLQCDGCGAAITINTDVTLSVSCHWCRNTLSLNSPIANGAVPDAILPSAVTENDARSRMAALVAQRGTYASKPFLIDFAQASIRLVYLPYLVVDAKATVRLDGEGWVRLREWSTSDGGANDHFETEAHVVTRDVDLLVDDLAIEARKSHSHLAATISTTNIINAIQPFDVKSAVRFNANYLQAGTTFERRDLDISTALPRAAEWLTTIARAEVTPTLSDFTSGVNWKAEQTSIHGSRWLSILLPVWLYSYAEPHEPGRPFMHYIAVNGRTGQVEGSVPPDTSAIESNARRWGWTAAGIVMAVFASPLIFMLGIDATFGAAAGSTEFNAAGIPCVGLFGAGMAYLAMRTARKQRSHYLSDRLLHPKARLKAESDVTHDATRVDAHDTYLGTFVATMSPWVPGRNDDAPDVRAESFTYAVGPQDQPMHDAAPDIASAFANDHPGARDVGTRRGERGLPRADGLDIQLASGGRLVIPWLKRP